MGALWLICGRTLRSHWRTSVVLVLLIGAGAGAMLGAAAGARRTATAFPRLVDELRPSDVVLTPLFDDPIGADDEAAVARLASVRELRRVWGFGLLERTPAGLPDVDGEGWFTTGGPDGRYPYQADRPKLVEGRLPPEDDPTGVAINSYSARRDGLGVGDTFAAMVFDVGVVARLEEPSSEAEARQLTDRYFTAVDLRVTGVYDRIEEISGQSESADDGAVLVSPAFVSTHRRHVSYRVLAVDLREGATPAELQAELRRRLPGRRFDALTSGDQVLDAVDRSVAPVVGALWVFAGLMAAAMVLVVGQVAARSARLEVVETAPLGALGMTRRDRVAATALRSAVVATAGAGVGAAVAVATSWLFPLAPVEQADPDPGLRVDVPVIVLGAVAVVALMVLRSAVAGWRATTAARNGPTGRPGLADTLARWGLPAPMVAGVRLALRPGAGAASLPPALTVVGAVVAIAAVVGAVGFGTNLDRLVDTPRLYGWTWDAMVFDPPEAGDQVAERIVEDQNLAAVTAIGSETVTVEDQSVFAAGFQPLRGTILPTVTEGRWPGGDDEAALGTKTMRRLDVSVGDTVEASGQGGEPRRLRVVGRVLVPVVVPDVSSTADVGEGMALTSAGLDALAGDVRRSSYFVDLADGGSGMAGLRSAYGELAFGPQQPPDIRNYARVRPVPLALAALVAALGAAMLANGLVGGVLNRRRDLAVLKTVGFDRRQVRWTVAWQATTLAVLALALGLPAGVVVGRQAWLFLAGRLAVPASPTTSLVFLAVVGLGTLALANLAAALAGIRASRLGPAAVLRAE